MEFWVRWFLILILSASSTAQATQFSSCATYLLSARANHYEESISEQYTLAAFQELDKFRSSQLRNLEFSISNSPATARENSSESDRRAVAARLATLYSDRKVINQNNSQGIPLKEKIYGTVVEGDQVDVELQSREKVRGEIEDLRFAMLAQPLSVVFGALYAATAVVLGGTAAQVHDPYSAAAIGGLFLVTRTFPEEAIRYLLDSFTFPKDEKVLRTALSQMPAMGGWYYRSFDVRVPIDVVRQIWQTKEATDQNFDEYITNTIVARTVKSVTGEKLLVPGIHRKASPSDGWLRVDELLTFNSEFKPKLVTMVRVAETLPVYPKTSPAPQRERATEPALRYVGARR